MKPVILLIINLVLVGVFLLLLRKKALLTYFQGEKFGWLGWQWPSLPSWMNSPPSFMPGWGFSFYWSKCDRFHSIYSLLYSLHDDAARRDSRDLREPWDFWWRGLFVFLPGSGPMVPLSLWPPSWWTMYWQPASRRWAQSKMPLLFYDVPPSKMTSSAHHLGHCRAEYPRHSRKRPIHVFDFYLAAFIFFNLIASGILSFDSDSLIRLKAGFDHTATRLQGGSFFRGYGIFIASIASCILAYSGVESVLQTAGLVRTWRENRKSLHLSGPHRWTCNTYCCDSGFICPHWFSPTWRDLITHYATLVNGIPFGIAVAGLASLALIMAIIRPLWPLASWWKELQSAIASAGSSPQIEGSPSTGFILSTLPFFHYHLYHPGKPDDPGRHVCIRSDCQFLHQHVLSYSLPLFHGDEGGCPISYEPYHHVGYWIILWVVSFSGLHETHGTMMWATVTGFVLLAGVLVAKKRSPEIKEIEKTDSEMSMILYLAQSACRKFTSSFAG